MADHTGDISSEADSAAPRTLRDRLSMPAWALYDFSDTIFSASILTLFFPLWVIKEAGGADEAVFTILFFNVGGDSVFAFTLSFSALVIAIASPLSGTISDSLNRRVPLLAVCVISCTGVTAVIGMFGGLTTGLALFFIANFLYQTGLVFYNSLIVNISSEENRGIVSGIGVGMGYVGLFVAFLIFRPQVAEHGEQWAFIPTALMYALFASPLLIIVRDIGQRNPLNPALIGDSYNRLYTTFRRARTHANLFKFIAARFIYMEAVNTVASFYLIYLVSIGVFTRDEALALITWVLIVAFSSSIAIGFLVSKFGSKRVLIVGVGGWACFVIAGSIVDSQFAFRVVAVTAGLFWAAPQIADRVLLTRLAPDGQVGEFFGLFQMSGRLSSAVGPALWGITTTLLWDLGELRFRIAMLMLAVFLCVGLAMLLWVRERREESDLSSSDATPAEPKVVD